MSPRVYVPTTLVDLARFHSAGEVTADADRVVAESDDEESEYAALMTAAAISAELRPPGRRRTVVVAELADADGAIPMTDVVAVHCDPADRPADADPDEDLAWFAQQEIPDLI